MRIILLAAAVLLAAPVQAQAIKLPIAPGFWTDASRQCASARYGYVFDGTRWGAFYFYGPKGTLGPNAELQPITATKGVAGGFTQMQFGGFDGAGYMRLKSVDATHAIYKVGAPFREEIQESEEQLVRCAFNSLAPDMQAGLRKYAPAIAK